MTFRNSLALASIVAMLGVTGSGCERDTSALKPAPADTNPLVFDDDFSSGSTYQAFLNSKVDAIDIDTSERYQGTASLKVTVPGPDDPSGWFAGGAFTTNQVRDFTGYDALVFWAKASMDATLDVAGIANDNTGTSRYEASVANLPLTTTWQEYVIAIPLPEKRDLEKGLFFFAEGHENDTGYEIWFDEIRYAYLGTISDPRPVMATQTVGAFVGGTMEIQGTATTFNVKGEDQTVQHLPGYFTFETSDNTVARVAGSSIQVVNSGDATITAKLGTIDVEGSVTVSVVPSPFTRAPVPTLPSADVISIFSNNYPDVAVDKWSADWDVADVTDYTIGGDDTKAYTNLLYAGIEFISQTINATDMTHLHLDVWVPEGSEFKVKLVDFGDDGVYTPFGDDSQHELTFDTASSPPLVTGSWVSLDIPLEDFADLQSTAHLAQLVISGDVGTAFLDNIYFHR